MIHLRSVQLSDRSEWLRLLGDLYPGHPASDHAPSVEAFLKKQPHSELLPIEVFVCEREEGGLAGFLELSVREYAEGCTGPTPYVESWFVEPDVRSSGIGRQLMEAAETWAREHGYHELASDADIANGLSQRAHQALGFSVVETTVHFRKLL